MWAEQINNNVGAGVKLITEPLTLTSNMTFKLAMYLNSNLDLRVNFVDLNAQMVFPSAAYDTFLEETQWIRMNGMRKYAKMDYINLASSAHCWS